MLFGQYRRQILTLLLLRPDETFYVRELERLSGMRPGPLHRELTALTEAGLVQRVPHGNQVRYRANRGAPLFGELAAIFRKTAEPDARAEIVPAEVREPVPGYVVPTPAYQRLGGKVPAALKKLSVSKRKVAALCRKWNVSRMWLFGSVTRDDFRPDSDVDVLVEFPFREGPGLFGLVDLRDELSALFGGRRVDVSTLAILRNPYRRKSIEKDIQVIYEPG